MTDNANNFKNPLRLKWLRETLLLTQEEIGILLSTYLGRVSTAGAISRYESVTEAAFRWPPADVLKAYSRIFKIPVSYMYSDIATEADVLEIRAKLLFKKGIPDEQINL